MALMTVAAFGRKHVENATVVEELLLYFSRLAAMIGRIPVNGVMLYSYSCVS